METVVYTCDRCGEIIVGKVYNLVMDSIKEDNVKYQLCPNCMIKTHQFLSNNSEDSNT